MVIARRALQAVPAVTGTVGATNAPARIRKESLADVLRRRSDAGEVVHRERTAAVQFSLAALTSNAAGALVDVPLDELHPHAMQHRFHMNPQRLAELAQSLAAEGQLQPVIARRVLRDGRSTLELVAGARRLAAAKLCDATIRPFPTLKVDVRELTDQEAQRISLIENLQRERLTPLEEGHYYWQLQQRAPRRWSVGAIAEFVHKQQRSIQHRLDQIKDPAVAEAVLHEQITRPAAFHILRLAAVERAACLRAAIAGRLTVGQIKAEVERRLVSCGSAEPSPAASDAAGEKGDKAPVKATARRRRGGSAPAADEARSAPLETQRQQSQARIKELRAALRAERQTLQAAERELAAPPA